jgi:hypothetical protein
MEVTKADVDRLSAQVQKGMAQMQAQLEKLPPDYARLFALDRVHELRISIDAATFRAMREDLPSMLPFGGIPAGRAGAPPARSGAACGGPFGKGGGLTSRDPCYVPVTVRRGRMSACATRATSRC